MSYIKYFLFLIFIVFNVNSAIVDTSATKTSQQYQSEICGEKSCEFIFKEMKKFARYGDPRAQATLSIMYARGIGTEVDQELSLKYIKRAAKNGLSLAEYSLGMLYRKDQIEGKYGQDANYWLTRAAEGGFKPAIDLLISEGKITPQEVNNYQKPVRAPVPKKDTEVIAVSTDKYSLTDFYEQLRNKGYGKLNQTGSRIKGRGCGSSATPCSTWDVSSDAGQVQFLLYMIKINR